MAKQLFLLPGRQAEIGGSLKSESQRDQEYENAGQGNEGNAQLKEHPSRSPECSAAKNKKSGKTLPEANFHHFAISL